MQVAKAHWGKYLQLCHIKLCKVSHTILPSGITIVQFVLGVYKTSSFELSGKQSRNDLFAAPLPLMWSLFWGTENIDASPVFSLEEINLLCIFITHLFVFLPSFLVQCTWCKEITWFFNSVEASDTASSSCLDVSTWPVGKGGVKGKDDMWCLNVVMIQVCWMWNDPGYNFRNAVNLWKIFSGKDLSQSWHSEWFALLLNVTLSVSYSLGCSAAGFVKYQLRKFQREIQTLASQSHWSGSHQRNHDWHQSCLLERPCIFWLGNGRQEIYLQTASWGGSQSLQLFWQLEIKAKGDWVI